MLTKIDRFVRIRNGECLLPELLNFIKSFASNRWQRDDFRYFKQFSICVTIFQYHVGDGLYRDVSRWLYRIMVCKCGTHNYRCLLWMRPHSWKCRTFDSIKFRVRNFVLLYFQFLRRYSINKERHQHPLLKIFSPNNETSESFGGVFSPSHLFILFSR